MSLQEKVKELEQEFESEIGRSVANGSRKKHSERVAILTVTLSVCVLMVGSAAFLLPAMSSAEGNPFSADVYSETDYLVYDEASDSLVHYVGDFDGEYDVKKSTNVKAMAYHAQGTYMKFSYTTNVDLDVVDHLDLSDEVVIANLEIPYVSSGATGGYVPWDMTVGGVSWDYNDVVYVGGEVVSVPTPASSWYDGSALRVRIGLPVLLEDAYIIVGDVRTELPSAYESGDEVAIHAQIRVTSPDDVTDFQAYLDGLTPTEDAFPEFPDYADLPVLALEVYEPVAMASTVTLEASDS